MTSDQPLKAEEHCDLNTLPEHHHDGTGLSNAFLLAMHLSRYDATLFIQARPYLPHPGPSRWQYLVSAGVDEAGRSCRQWRDAPPYFIHREARHIAEHHRARVKDEKTAAIYAHAASLAGQAEMIELLERAGGRP